MHSDWKSAAAGLFFSFQWMFRAVRSFSRHIPFYGSRSTMSPTTTTQKLSGYEFYNKALGNPKFIVAPMVDQSEHAWRVLCRRHGAQVCFTPMFHARLFSEPGHGEKYRAEQWSSDKDDRPLIVQVSAIFCELFNSSFLYPNITLPCSFAPTIPISYSVQQSWSKMIAMLLT